MNAVLSLTPRFVDNVKAGNRSECVRGGGILLLQQVHTLISMAITSLTIPLISSVGLMLA